MTSPKRKATIERFLLLTSAARRLGPAARQAAIEHAFREWAAAHPEDAEPIARRLGEEWDDWLARMRTAAEWQAACDAFVAADPVVAAAEKATSMLRGLCEVFVQSPETGR